MPTQVKLLRLRALVMGAVLPATSWAEPPPPAREPPPPTAAPPPTDIPPPTGALPPAEQPSRPLPSPGGYFLPGPIMAVGGGGVGLGAELSWMHYRDAGSGGIGAFSQLDARLKGDDQHIRAALGAQIGSVLGLELGAAWLSKSNSYRSTWAGHVGPFLSLGIFTIAFRWTIPPTGGGGDHATERHTEVAVVLAFKFPVSYGTPITFRGGAHGRALLVSGAPRVATLVSALRRTRP